VYSGITSTKSPSFYLTTFSASLAYFMVLLPQSYDCSCYVSTCTTLPTCDISLGRLTLLAPEAGGFVELLVSYTVRNNSGAFADFLWNYPENCMTCERSTFDIKCEFRCLCIVCQNRFFLRNIKSITHE
jgi:hypothetical protein